MTGWWVVLGRRDREDDEEDVEKEEEVRSEEETERTASSTRAGCRGVTFKAVMSPDTREDERGGESVDD